MATAAPPAQQTTASDNRVHLYRLLTLTVDEGTTIARKIVDEHCHNVPLYVILANEKPSINRLRASKTITKVQYDLMFPASGTPTTADFDLTLSICLLRNLPIFGLNQNPSWKTQPSPGDTSLVADLRRLQMCRNELAHIPSTTGIAEPDFKTKWSNTEQILIRLNSSLQNPNQTMQQMINDCKNCPLDSKTMSQIEHEIKKLQKIEDRVQEVEHEVEKLNVTVLEFHGVKDEVHIVKDDVLKVNTEVHDVKDGVRVVKDEVHKVTDVVYEVKEEVHKVTAVVHEVKKEVHDVNDQVHDVKHKVHAVKDEVRDVQHGVFEVKEDFHKLNKQVEEIQKKSEGGTHKSNGSFFNRLKRKIQMPWKKRGKEDAKEERQMGKGAEDEREEYLKKRKPSLIPVEISRMDKKSIELYKSALSDGKEAVHAIRVMVVGHYGVGKTTLTKRLFGEEVDINKRESTNGIDVHVRRCKVAMDTGTWNVIEKDQNVASASLRLVKLLKGSTSDKNKRKMENSEKGADTGIKTKEQLKMKSETTNKTAG